MKLKKGDNLKIIGFITDSQKNLNKIIFESPAGNKIEMTADGEKHQYHYISMDLVNETKPEEELEIT